MTKLVIIGTGLAGYTLAREFRRRDQDTELLLITSDDGSYYSKPMLSNALSKDKQADELIMVNANKMAEDLNADIWTNTTVSQIDVQAHSLQTERGVESYDRLVLANGANTITAPIKGDATDRILSVNNLEDYRKFRTALEKGRDIVIIGAGMIGCEFANDLSNAADSISVVDLASQVLGQLLPEQASLALQAKLTELGVNWYLDNSVINVDHCEDGLSVTLKDERTIIADIVLSAIGLLPSLELVKAAGLETGRGLKVDRYMRTSDKDIYALGDCAQVEDLTLPFVMPLMTSARALAATLSGDETAVKYPPMPVALKTPCYPVIVCPAPRRVDGYWQEEVTDQGIRALFKDKDDNPIGFVLTGELVAEKTVLSKQVADWLP